ncbi:MAG: DUF739 family protein [Clostridia bacterium]|nr:DUF739 family protein [Clostridia bacterium]
MSTYDYSLLKEKIKKVYGTQKRFTAAVGCSERTMSLKLNSKIPFTQPEISKIATLLEIAQNEICDYFFSSKVQKC